MKNSEISLPVFNPVIKVLWTCTLHLFYFLLHSFLTIFHIYLIEYEDVWTRSFGVTQTTELEILQSFCETRRPLFRSGLGYQRTSVLKTEQIQIFPPGGNFASLSSVYKRPLRLAHFSHVCQSQVAFQPKLRQNKISVTSLWALSLFLPLLYHISDTSALLQHILWCCTYTRWDYHFIVIRTHRCNSELIQ